MALIIDAQLRTRAETILDWLEARAVMPAKSTDAKEEAIVRMQKILNEICDYMVDYMVIKGVAVTTGTLHAAVTPAVTPQDGGLTLYSSQLKTDVNDKTLSQNNNTTGHVE